MRKWYMTFSLFALFTFGIAFLTSCNQVECGGSSIAFQRLINPEGAVRVVMPSSQVTDGVEYFQTTTSDGTARPFDELAFELSYELENYAMHQERPVTFGKQAFACSPIEPPNVLNGISIIADRDFATDLPAGSELNDLFLFSTNREYSQTGIPGWTLLDGEAVFLTLNKSPMTEGPFTFTFRLQLGEGIEEEVAIREVRFTR